MPKSILLQLPAHQSLVLGTAMWAWTVPRERCFDILDTFYVLGGRRIDTATNYPINKQAADFRAAERILADWLEAHEVKDLEVIVKVGSVNNMKTPEHLLSPSFLQLCRQEYQALLGANLDTLMIHWDNREDATAIQASLATLDEWRQEGLSIGLSGIRHPTIYAPLLEALGWKDVPLQLKHNVIYSDYNRYAPLHAYVSPIAYGITGGGLKLTAQTKGESLQARGGTASTHTELLRGLRNWLADWEYDIPMPERMNHIGMLYALYHSGINQVLLGASRPTHVEDSFQWYTYLQEYDYQIMYEQLQNLTEANG